MHKFFQKYRVLMIAGAIVVVCAVGSILLSMNKGNVDIETLQPSTTPDTVLAEEDKTIMVHVKGAVQKEGLYELNEDARVNDAITAAGGALETADYTDVNLALQLQDGDEVWIPDVSSDSKRQVVSNPGRDGAVGSGGKLKSGQKINLNTATVAQLTAIPGVGESTAQKIVDYRDKKPFKRIEDIMNVSGIGERKFESMKEFLEV